MLGTDPRSIASKAGSKGRGTLFVRVAEHAKAWKYYNTISRHVQNSQNITFDERDTKLYPISDEDNNDVPLKGGEPIT